MAQQLHHGFVIGDEMRVVKTQQRRLRLQARTDEANLLRQRQRRIAAFAQDWLHPLLAVGEQEQRQLPRHRIRRGRHARRQGEPERRAIVFAGQRGGQRALAHPGHARQCHAAVQGELATQLRQIGLPHHALRGRDGHILQRAQIFHCFDHFFFECARHGDRARSGVGFGSQLHQARGVVGRVLQIERGDEQRAHRGLIGLPAILLEAADLRRAVAHGDGEFLLGQAGAAAEKLQQFTEGGERLGRGRRWAGGSRHG